jgi:hypothetical protein
MTLLTSALIARHWPFLDEHLVLGRWKNGRAALELLSQLQVETGGEPVNLGRKRLNSACESAGEGGALWRALVELERRQVITRQRGRGARPDAWSFRPEVGRWRAMPWKHSGRGVQRALEGCRICRALCAEDAIFPGPRFTLLRGHEEFRLDWRHHLGVYPPQSRGKSAERAGNAQGRAWQPVDTRGYGAEIGASQAPPTVLSVDLKDLLIANTGGGERHARFKAMIDRGATPGQAVWAGTSLDRTLMEIAIDSTDEEAEELRYVWSQAHKGQTPVTIGVADLKELLPEAKRAVASRAAQEA